MNKLPSRSDEIYKEIESFEEYELTQCVAYEMAIRNEDNLKAVEELKKLYFSCMEDIQGDVLIKFECTNALVDKIDKIDFLSYDYEEKRLNIHYILNKTYSMEKESISPFSSKIDSLNARNGNKTQINRRKGYNIIIDLNHINEINLNDIIVGKEKPYRIINHISTKGVSINANFKRPQIKIQDKTKSINASLQLDINQPLNELIAYITHIKKDLEENQDILKAPIELLGEELHKTNDTPKQKAKRWADMFFIYDYVTQRLKEIEELNNQAKQEYEEKLQEIKENKDLSKKEKAIQKSVAHAEYLENCIDTTRKDIFKELEQQLNIKKDSISKLYYAIKPYIDESKYKELVTGISAL